MCCDSWGHKESDTTEQLNLTELNYSSVNIGVLLPKLIEEKKVKAEIKIEH